jgi:hypothetical protein
MIEGLRDGTVVPLRGEADAAECRLHDGAGGTIRACFDGTRSLRLRGEGLGIRLRCHTGPGMVAYREGSGGATLNARLEFRRYHVEPLAGTVVLDAPWGEAHCPHIIIDCLPGADGHVEVALDEFWSTWVDRPRSPYPRVHDGIVAAFDDFRHAFGRPPATAALAEAWTDAILCLWNAAVEPMGLFRRPAILMSKVWMDNVWSWDHCFNAQALAGAHDALAWDQLLVMFDHQDDFGCIPDALNDGFLHYNFSKPPVHGWTVRELLRTSDATIADGHLAAVYDHLRRWSDWWLLHRRRPGEALPWYLHGNDSGWDNSTMFAAGVPLMAPDLAALLVDQSAAVAELAVRLGHAGEAARWQQRSEEMLAALIAGLWDGHRFTARRLVDDRWQPVPCDSLIPCIPIFLGRRLPAAIQAVIRDDVARFITPHGLATELPTSPAYRSDGYWRGPSWAPSTVLVAKGLDEIGATDLARTLAERFCATCAAGGFAENFDALTGAPLRDPDYTWTASGFIMLVRRFHL